MELERGPAGAVLPWHVRAAEVTVRGKLGHAAVLRFSRAGVSLGRENSL